MKYFILFLAPLFLFTLSFCHPEIEEKPDSWVFDHENIFTKAQEEHLDSLITDFEQRTTNEIVMITVHDIGDSKTMAEHATMLGNNLGVGKKDKDNGLVILFSRNLRETFLATGYGTEKILKDEVCKQIVDSIMIPHFKENQYYEGLEAGLKECMNRWEGLE